MAFALKVENTWDKELILTSYLKSVEYGNQATGCAAAASLYFKKPLEDLSLAECAFLAGLPQAPTRLNPYRNFEGAKKRQEWILSRMHDDGRLTATEASQAAAEPLRLRRWTGGFEAPHFVEMLLANARISIRHAWETVWWEWIFNLRGLLYYSKDAGHSYTNAIYLLGNPVVIWLVAAGVAASATLLTCACRCRRFGAAPGVLAVYFAALDRWAPLWAVLAYCLCAYAANLAP
jgi:hypothetical protein